MIHAINKRVRMLSTTAALSLMLATAPQAFADTPKDTVVLAWAFDDIISLDPAEAFELSAGEIMGNTYDNLVNLDLEDTSKVTPGIAESWTVSDDALTYTFKIKPDIEFASGNPITAADVAYTFERAVKLDLSPAFILTQFGLTKDNVTEKAKAIDDLTFQLTVDKAYAPSFVLNCLTANIGSIVDKALLEQHVENGDFGHGWLKTNYAGSGPFKMQQWRANEIIVLERNDNYYGEQAKLKRAFYRHMKESSGQRLALEAGDIDIARNLAPSDLDALESNEDIDTVSASKGSIYYLGLNQRNENLARPEVRKALKYLVDYDAIGATLIKGIGEIHQTFVPEGMLGSLDGTPYELDVEKARELLEKAGLKDGFSVTMDVRSIEPITGIAQSMQQTFAQAGVKLEIIPGDGKQTLTKYRARNHDIYIGRWGTDYWDPNSNADTFAANPDNSDDAAAKPLAWRNAWDIPELTKKTSAALLERDEGKRAEMYRDLQKQVLESGPFVIVFQQTEVAAHRVSAPGFKLGPTFDTNVLSTITKE